MSRYTWSLFAAWFFICLYTLSVFYAFGDLITFQHGHGHENEIAEVADPDTKSDDDTGSFFCIWTVLHITEIVVQLGMLIASILMLLGIKKQNYKLITPWLWMSFIAMFVYISSFFIKEETVMENFLSFVIAIAVIVFWFPIYKHCKDLYYPNNCQKSVAPTEKCCCHLNSYTNGNAVIYPNGNAAIYPNNTQFVHSASAFTNQGLTTVSV